MKTISHFILIILYTILLSCAKSNNILEGQQNSLSNLVLSITNDSFMQVADINETHNDVGKYQHFFRESDATIGISSYRYYPLGEETVMAFYDPINAGETKGSMICDDTPNILINGKNVFSPKTKSGDGSIVALFGSCISFNISGIGTSEKSRELSEINLYAPQIIKVEFPSVTSEENRYPLCYYKKFVVRWNPDNHNSNGVIIIVKWNGTMVFGEDYQSSCVHHYICVPDNGTAELDESMFKGIPDAAYCSLFILRGDIENIEINDVTYRLLAESHDVLDFILVRNIE